MIRSPERSLRVLVVNLGKSGGVTEYGWLMARALSQLCEIAVIYSSGAENGYKWKSLDVPLLEVETYSSKFGMLSSMLSVSRFRKMRQLALKFNPDIVYYPGGHPYKSILDYVLPRSARIVLTIHDPELHHGENLLRHRLIAAASLLRVDGSVLLNNSQSAEYIRHHNLDPAKVTTIPHGIFEDFPMVDAIPPLAGRTGLLFIGRIRPYKGIEVLLDAYRDASIDPAVPLLIAGNGQLSPAETASLAKLQTAGRPVRLINRWLEPEELPALVSTARFVVLPYTQATQSGIIPLASVLGVPAIAAAAGGIVEQVIDRQTGYLFAPGDVNALGATLREALALNETAYAAMAEACAAHAKAEWDWGILAEKLVNFFREV